MYWKLEALTANRSEITKIIEGSLEDVKAQAAVYDLEILEINPDYKTLIKNIFQSSKLSASMMAVFFKDFADMQRSGVSVNEAINTLNETTPNVILKDALRKIINFINDGRSLEEAFDNTRIFPRIVTVTLSVAERSGNIPELLDLLAQYYKIMEENNKKILKSMVYPAVVFCMLSGLSVFISITLVPQLKSFLPPSAQSNLSAIILINYADFIKGYWWALILCLTSAVFIIKYLWDNKREELMQTVFRIPVLGNLMKNMELTQIFLNLYVYQKSGVNIIETITNIHQANKTYITDKLILIKDRVFKGASLGEAFKLDPFFPSFIYQNLTKGQISGYLPQYMERIYKYYDIRTKDSVGTMIALVEPTLLISAALFLLMIVCTFILPIYTNMDQIGAGIFK